VSGSVNGINHCTVKLCAEPVTKVNAGHPKEVRARGGTRQPVVSVARADVSACPPNEKSESVSEKEKLFLAGSVVVTFGGRD